MTDHPSPLKPLWSDDAEQVAALRRLLREKDDEIRQLRSVLQELRSLLSDSVLVRDISQDDDTAHFLRQGMRLAAFVLRLNEALRDVPDA